MYWQDLFSSPRVQMMNAAELGAYMALLGAQWLNNGKGLPTKSPAALRRLARLDRRRPDFDLVLSCFEEDEQGRLLNQKAHEQWEDSQRFVETQTRKGRKGGRPGNPRVSSGLPTGFDLGNPQEEGEEVEEIPSTDFRGEGSMPGPKRAEDVPIPHELDTPEFREAWFERWLPWRRSQEGRNKPVSVLAAKSQLAKLAPCGPGQACIAIAASISNDWQGLFPEPPEPRELSYDEMRARMEQKRWR